MTNRDPYTTASADPRNAAANYQVELEAVEEVAVKIFASGQGSSGQLTAHIQAVRLLASAQ